MKCDFCKKTIISGVYYTVNEKHICIKCYNKLHQCDVCGSFMNDYIKVSDGREICRNCYEVGITDKKTALRFLKYAKKFCKEITGLEVKMDIDIDVVNSDYLNKQLKTKTKFTKHYDERYIGFCGYQYRIIKGEKEINELRILIENHLPAKEFIRILIHEYGHAIYNIYKKRKKQIIKDESEGIARWLEYKYIRRFEDKEFKEHFVLKNRYHHKALIAIMKLERESGEKGVIKKILM